MIDMSKPPVMIRFEDQNLPLKEWSRQTGIPVATLRYRHKKGLPPEQVLAPIREEHKRSGRGEDRIVTYDGVTQSLKAWARSTGIPYATLYRRIYEKEQSPELALNTPVRAGGWSKKTDA